MAPLNHCRKFAKYLARNQKQARGMMSLGININAFGDALRTAEKFIIAEGVGGVHPDSMKALDDASLVKLPFPNIAIEYIATSDTEVPEGFLPVGEVSDTERRIISAQDVDDRLVITGAYYSRSARLWSVTATLAIDKSEFVKLNKPWDEAQCLLLQHKDCRPMPEDMQKAFTQDTSSEVTILSEFLGALACSNIETEKRPGSSCKKKSPFPYDDYHHLVVRPSVSRTGSGEAVGERRGPREHVRRGHIRRLPDGRRIWVNAAVIAAGSGGTIHKDYAVQVNG